MKKFLVVLLLVVLAIPVFSQDLPLARRINDDNLRQNSFDNLVRSTYCSLSSTQHVTPNDITATGTYTSAYLGTEEGPLLLRIQNLGTTGKIYFKEYSASAGTGVAVTAATDPFLPSTHGNYLATGTAGQLAPGEVWEKIYYEEPDLTFGGVAAATFTIQVFKQSAAE